jgi:hypothetical protein
MTNKCDLAAAKAISAIPTVALHTAPALSRPAKATAPLSVRID